MWQSMIIWRKQLANRASLARTYMKADIFWYFDDSRRQDKWREIRHTHGPIYAVVMKKQQRKRSSENIAGMQYGRARSTTANYGWAAMTVISVTRLKFVPMRFRVGDIATIDSEGSSRQFHLQYCRRGAFDAILWFIIIFIYWGVLIVRRRRWPGRNAMR